MVPGIYDPKNLGRVRLAQTIVIVLAIGLSAYAAVTTVISLQEIWSARKLLYDAKKESAALSRQAAVERRQEMKQAKLERGGVDAFAVSFANWSKSRQVRVDSCTPESVPTPTEITSGSAKLGIWKMVKVRVKGRGEFQAVMSVLEEFKNTLAPIRLESFALQSSQDNNGTSVAFDLLVTVYEKASEADVAS